MSIKINGKTIAGLCVPNSASETEEGVIRIATDEEAKAGELTNVAVTPKQLAENGGSTEVDTSNLVTLDGEQTITGAKTFGSDVQLGSNSLSFSDGALTLNPQGSSNLNITTMGGALDVTGNLTLTGNIKAYQNQAKPIELRSNGSTMSMVYGDNTLNMSDDSLTYTNASGETKDLLAGGGSSDNVVTLDTDQTITGKKTFTQQVQCSPVNSYKDMWLGQSGPGAYGLVFQSNSSPYEFTIYNQGYTASSLKVAGFEGGVKFANTVNFNSSIYDKDGNEIVGGSSGGSVDTSNLVTTDTEQVITGKKIIQNRNSDSFGGAPDGLVFRCKDPKVDSWEAYIKATNSSGSSNDGVLYLGNTYGGVEIHRNDLHVGSILPKFNASTINIGPSNNDGSAIFYTGKQGNGASLYIRSGGDGSYAPALNTSSIVAGDNISIEKDTKKGIVTISATGGGSSSGESEFTWGDNIAEETMNNECYLYHTPSGMLIQGGYITGRGGWDDPDMFTMNFEKPYTELLSLVLVCPDDNSVPFYMADYEDTYVASFTVFPPPGPMMQYQWIAFGY